MNRRYRDRRRHGVSEVEGAVLTIAITLIAGAALFGYVNDEAATNEQQLGQAAGGNVNYLNEMFVVAQMTFGCSSTCTQGSADTITVYIYNNGDNALGIASVELYGSPRSSMDLLYNATGVFDLNAPTGDANSCAVIPPGGLESPSVTAFSDPVGQTASIRLVLPNTLAPCFSGAFMSQNAYTVSVVGTYGNIVTSYQVYLS